MASSVVLFPYQAAAAAVDWYNPSGALILYFKWFLHALVVVVSVLHSVLNVATSTATNLATAATGWGWSEDAVYLTEAAANLTFLLLAFLFLRVAKRTLLGDPQQELRVRLQQAQRDNADLLTPCKDQQCRIRELERTGIALKRQIRLHIPIQLRAAAALGLDFLRFSEIAPLLDFARIVGAGGKDVETADVSGILQLQAFHGFKEIYKAIPAVQASAQRNAATLLMVMLRCLRESPPLRDEVHGILVPYFADNTSKWSSLNIRLYRKWDELQFGEVMALIVDETQLQRVPLKHTRVAAMQMLALLMHHGFVV